MSIESLQLRLICEFGHDRIINPHVPPSRRSFFLSLADLCSLQSRSDESLKPPFSLAGLKFAVSSQLHNGTGHMRVLGGVTISLHRQRVNVQTIISTSAAGSRH